MKLIVSAVALAIASPALAHQNAPANPHAGHTAPAKMETCTAEHAKMGHCKMAPAADKKADGMKMSKDKKMDAAKAPK